MKKYSLVIHPEELLEDINKIKQDLKSVIGWYSSVNSLAHFTICEFFADNLQLNIVMKEVSTLISNWPTQLITLHGFGSFENGAYYIKPDEPSTIYLEELFEAVGSRVKQVIPDVYYSTYPHLSIGRRLDKAQLQIAKENYSSYSNTFLCKGVMLREYNPIRRQFDLKEFIQFQ